MNYAMLSVVLETFSQMARPDSDLLGLQLCGNFGKTPSASCLSRTGRALPRVNLHYFCLSRMCNASQSDFVKFWLLWGKIKKALFVVVVFQE